MSNHDTPDRDLGHDEVQLHADPEDERIASLLDALAQADRASMSDAARDRTLDAISQVFAPAPISITSTPDDPAPARATPGHWGIRASAAALVAMAATLGIIAAQPWKQPAPPSPTNAPNGGAWTLAAFEEDLDAFLALEEYEHDQIDEAVATLELWAQTIEDDISTDALSDEYGFTSTMDGAL